MVLALSQRKSVQILKSPDFFQTRTSGKAYSLTDTDDALQLREHLSRFMVVCWRDTAIG